MNTNLALTILISRGADVSVVSNAAAPGGASTLAQLVPNIPGRWMLRCKFTSAVDATGVADPNSCFLLSAMTADVAGRLGLIHEGDDVLFFSRVSQADVAANHAWTMSNLAAAAAATSYDTSIDAWWVGP